MPVAQVDERDLVEFRLQSGGVGRPYGFCGASVEEEGLSSVIRSASLMRISVLISIPELRSMLDSITGTFRETGWVEYIRSSNSIRGLHSIVAPLLSLLRYHRRALRLRIAPS